LEAVWRKRPALRAACLALQRANSKTLSRNRLLCDGFSALALAAAAFKHLFLFT